MSDSSGIGDGVTVAVNDETVQGDDVASPDAKGPDPAVWGEGDGPAPHDASADKAAAAYEAASGDDVKGPGPEWDDAARAERGAENGPQADEGGNADPKADSPS